MGKDRRRAPEEQRGESEYESGSEYSSDDRKRSWRNKKRSRSRSSGRRDDDAEDSDECSDESYTTSSSEEDSRRRKRRRERSKIEEKEERRRRRKEKDKKKKKKRREEEEKIKKKKKKKEKKKKDKEKGKKTAVTNSWGKYGTIRETDMWNKRPEFTAWLAEVKKVNLESLPNWEEKQMFKEFMEDHNTATFPSKKYYDLDGYYRRKMEKEMKKGQRKVVETERTVFNDEEQRRQELLQERERQKEQEVEALKRSMQSGMAQAMKEQAQLREEMAYQYKIGNIEAAAAIQRRLDPDVAM